jgi:hypothetical protein
MFFSGGGPRATFRSIQDPDGVVQAFFQAQRVALGLPRSPGPSVSEVARTPCGGCLGYGLIPCAECGGQGLRDHPFKFFIPNDPHTLAQSRWGCPPCHAEGAILCPICRGSG